MSLKLKLLFALIFAAFISCKHTDKKMTNGELVQNWDYAQDYYLQSIKNSISYLDSLATLQVDDSLAKPFFIKTRQEFKKAEPYAAYLNPEVGHSANGPALPTMTDDSQRILQPIGLQKLEESIYEGGVSNANFQYEVKMTRGLMEVLRDDIEKRKLDAQRFFIATHQQLLRIISFSISGFDTPVSHLGLNEAKLSLEGLWEVYEHSLRAIIQKKDDRLDKEFKVQIDDAITFLKKNDDFNTFDRYTFIRDYMNPITRSWVAIRKTSDIWQGTKSKPFNFDAPTFFENNSFNVTYFTPVTHRNPSDKQISLGKKLFFDPKLSTSGTMACATCHIPEKAYADGLMTNLNNKGAALARNTPTLINAVFQKGFFWDGRSSTLVDQITGVFTNKEEFDSNVHEFSLDVTQDSAYAKEFRETFGGSQWSNADVIKALSSYIATLNAFNSKFDRNIRAEESTFSETEKQGFNLFMGKALCATCHFIPLTNGTVPPFFSESEREVIGVPGTAANIKLDDDLGFYWRYGKEVQKGMFKTPTVRNAALTSPYMHNGVYKTLEEVIDFYNKGGGGGLGFDLPHQTLPFDHLDLTDEDQVALVAFIKTLSDVPQEQVIKKGEKKI